MWVKYENFKRETKRRIAKIGQVAWMGQMRKFEEELDMVGPLIETS